MKRIKTFDSGDRMYHLDISYAHPNILTSGDPDRVMASADMFDNIEEINQKRGLVSIHGTYKNTPITFFSTGMAPGSVSITLPEIIEACDEPNMKIIRLGTSGGLSMKLNVGDMVISDNVIAKETTSNAIMGPDYKPKADKYVMNNLKMVSNILRMPQQKVHVGTTMVTNNIYTFREEPNANYEGLLSVSMEFSVIAALRDWYNQHAKEYGVKKNIKAGNLLLVSDIAPEVNSNVDMSHFEKNKGLYQDILLRTGFETLVTLDKKNQKY